MKKLGCAVIAALLLLLFVVVVLLGGRGGDALASCLPGAATPTPGGEGVPAGAYSLPEAGARDRVTSPFGARDGGQHKGVDIAGQPGSPIYAFADGVVAAAGPADGFGNWIVVNHTFEGRTYSTVYGHMFADGIHVQQGDTVRAGQHIADEGYDGEVSPPGPQGAHLHFEVWDGGRLTQGSAVDPIPFLNKAVEPGIQGTTTTTGASAQAPAGSMAELTASPHFAEAHMQENAVRMGRAVAMNFPTITTIGGWRPLDATADDHPQGRAVDVMIPDWNSDEGVGLGDSIVAYVLANWDFFHVDYIIWRQHLIYPGSSTLMEDRGSSTQNHYDHVHISLTPSAQASENTVVGAGPVGGSAPQAASGVEPVGENAKNCDTYVHAIEQDTDMSLNTTNIPDTWVHPIQIAGSTCSAVSPALIAALLEQESGFNTGLTSSAGAAGPAQFMPSTWASVGAEMSDDGQMIGPAGSGDINDPKDAIPAAGRYLCGIADRQRPLINSGAISGDDTALMLAGYNAGEGAVEHYGGVPPFQETDNYVRSITSKAIKYKELTHP